MFYKVLCDSRSSSKWIQPHRSLCFFQELALALGCDPRRGNEALIMVSLKKYFSRAKCSFRSLRSNSAKGITCALFIFPLFQIITILLTSSVSAALAIAHVGKKGNSHAGWLPICGQVPKFCNQVTGSLIAAFIAAIVYLVLILYSLRTVLSPLITV